MLIFTTVYCIILKGKTFTGQEVSITHHLKATIENTAKVVLYQLVSFYNFYVIDFRSFITLTEKQYESTWPQRYKII